MIDMKNYGRWGSHLSILTACVVETNGPVLELGIGHYSTPVLHYLCKRRLLVSVDNSSKWMDDFRKFETERHKILLGENSLNDYSDVFWDVIFVDQSPANSRIESLRKYAMKSKYIVVHDTDRPVYRYDQVWPLFKYKVDFKTYLPWTTVVSNYENPLTFLGCLQ